ncbi:MAG TPA: hypothetical protein PLP30_10900 [Clostridia bacterium]|jgi:hypothetical protein|nr:hypothetical protein [Clostridia bacterium]HPQ47868.1 hypothetical protein [Clostridia bacterium]HRX42996.1 hypothetical protein [Clostridia bacterium]
MKSKMNTILTAVLAIVILFSGFARSASGQDLVLASVDYVDAKFNELLARMNTIPMGGTTGTDGNTLTRVNNLEIQTGQLETDMDSARKRIDFMDNTVRNLSEGTSYQVVKVDPGIRILASDTGEVILRSGTARVIGNEYGEGVSDLTSGTELKPGASVPKDHLILIPRGDGRGIITDTVCYIIYKGLYYLQ